MDFLLELKCLTELIGEDWNQVGIQLSLTEKVIQDVKYGHEHDQSKAFHMIHFWIHQRNAMEARDWLVLERALKETGHYLLVPFVRDMSIAYQSTIYGYTEDPVVTQTGESEVDERTMLFLSKNLGHLYDHIGYQLGLKGSIIREIKFGHMYENPSSTIYHMLHFWRQRRGEHATYYTLANALKYLPGGRERRIILNFLQARRKCMQQLASPLTGSAEVTSEEKEETQSTRKDVYHVCTAGIISNEGGILSIENSGVKLSIPPNALPEGKDSVFIQMRIIPRGAHEAPEKSFATQSTVMVEILPSGLKLRRPVKLTLPHCLKLLSKSSKFVRLFQSHHKEGEPLMWEDVTEEVDFKLGDNDCQMWLKQFSWTKYEIAGEIVWAKKLILYVASEKCRRDSEYLTIDVGYYPAIPGEDTSSGTRSEDWYFESAEEFTFRKSPKCDLDIWLEEINPPEWTPTASSTSPQSISYFMIESSTKQRVHFIFKRDNQATLFPRCIFKANAQGETSRLYINTQKGVLGEEADVVNRMTSLTLYDLSEDPCAVGDAGSSIIDTQGKGPFFNPGLPRTTTAIRLPHEQSMLAYGGLVRAYGGQMLSWCNPAPLHAFSQRMPAVSGSTPEIFNDLRPNQIRKLGYLLNVPHALNNDWQYLAGELGFTVTEIENLRKEQDPTWAVILAAAQKSSLKSKQQLINILSEMGRQDCVTCLSEHQE